MIAIRQSCTIIFPPCLFMQSRDLVHYLHRPDISSHKHSAPIQALVYEKGVVYTASRDSFIRSWSESSQEGLQSLGLFAGHSGWVQDIQMHYSSQTLVSVSCDHTLRTWKPLLQDRETVQRPFQTVLKHGDGVERVCVEQSSGRLVSAGLGGEIYAWDLSDMRSSISTPKTRGESIYSLDLDPKQSLVAFGSCEGKLSLWDYRQFELSGTLPGHSGNIRALRYCHGDLLSGGSDGYVRFWDLRMMKEIWEIRPLQGSVWGIELDEYSRKMYVCGNSHEIKSVNILSKTVEDYKDVQSCARAKVSKIMGQTYIPELRELWFSDEHSSVYSMDKDLENDPKLVIEGIPPIVRAERASDQVHVQVTDSVGESYCWNVMRGTVSEGFQGNEEDIGHSWFSVDLSLGVLGIALERKSVFNSPRILDFSSVSESRLLTETAVEEIQRIGVSAKGFGQISVNRGLMFVQRIFQELRDYYSSDPNSEQSLFTEHVHCKTKRDLLESFRGKKLKDVGNLLEDWLKDAIINNTIRFKDHLVKFKLAPHHSSTLPDIAGKGHFSTADHLTTRRISAFIISTLETDEASIHEYKERLRRAEHRPDSVLPFPEEIIEVVHESGDSIDPHVSVHYLKQQYSPNPLLLYYRLRPFTSSS